MLARDPRTDPRPNDRWDLHGRVFRVGNASPAAIETIFDDTLGELRLLRNIPDGAIFLGGADGLVGERDGLREAPVRYGGMLGTRETIDAIRDELYALDGTDNGFVAFCIGQTIRYTDRAGLKEGVTWERDHAAAEWYAAMARHVRGEGPDPRHVRGDAFVPYVRRVVP